MTAIVTYTATITIPSGRTAAVDNTAVAILSVGSQTTVATFTLISAVTASISDTPGTITAAVSGGTELPSILPIDLTFYFSNPNVTGAFPGVTYTHPTLTEAPDTLSKTPTPATALTASTNSSLNTAPTPIVSSTSSSPKSPSSSTVTVGDVGHKTLYNGGIPAGAAVGCLFAGILLAALILFLCRRKIAASRYGMPGDSGKQRPLLQGHGDAALVPNDTGKGWEKDLPQSDSDSTVRALASQTLDQIALHVENFYTTKPEIALSTEDEFELENVDYSRLNHAISTMLPCSRRVEPLIKHCMSSFILAMINFEDSGAVGTFLPKMYRRQWQPSLQNVDELTQAYSRWRVLTAYLRQSNGDDKTYLSERDAVIDTAARQICRAFEPWAKARDDNRISNMVGIMRRASEMGVLLFSQPAKFEWQWQPSSNGIGAENNPQAKIVMLPGLYKVSDQKAMPLASPLRLVEPSIVVFEEL